MLASPLTLTYNAVSVTLNRINQDNYAGTYFGKDNGDSFTLSVKHTLPSAKGAGESHLVRLDVERYDTEGSYLRTDSAWMVIKSDAKQDDSESELVVDALTSLVTGGTFAAQVLGRES